MKFLLCGNPSGKQHIALDNVLKLFLQRLLLFNNHNRTINNREQGILKKFKMLLLVFRSRIVS